ncbi:MAG TPA: AbrB/MazE/SpoVT family DNA-binding domain-containing protein [Armatimonadota bacterium]
MVGKTGEDCFYGSVTVGERGQVVIPADVRKAVGIEPGDRLLVFRPPMHDHIVMAKIDSVHEVLGFFQKLIDEIHQADS